MLDQQAQRRRIVAAQPHAGRGLTVEAVQRRLQGAHRGQYRR
mgnify:CR=1 FL=1